MRILVRTPNWIGDQILAYPFFFQLRAALPDAWITALCSPWVQSIQYREQVNEVIVLSSPAAGGGLMRRLRDLERESVRLRARGQSWDLGILLAPSFSSAWMLRRGGVRRLVGTSTDGRGFLLQGRFRRSPGQKRADEYLGLLEWVLRDLKIERKIVSASDFWPKRGSAELESVQIREEDPGLVERFLGQKEWPDADLKRMEGREYFVIAPGSNAPSRTWPLERYADLIRRLQAHPKTRDWTGVIAGGPGESALAEQLKEKCGGHLIDLTRRGKSVASLYPVMSRARFVVSNDSGLAHLAALCGAEVVIPWGAGDPKRTAPLGPGHTRILFSSPDCWPCEKNECQFVDDRRLRCLVDVSAERVLEQIEFVLAKKPEAHA